MNDDIRIQVNGKEVQNSVARKGLGVMFVIIAPLLLVAGVLLLMFLPFVLLIIFMVLAVVAWPFDWLLKKLGRVGMLYSDGSGYFSFIFGKGMFAKVSQETDDAPKTDKE